MYNIDKQYNNLLGLDLRSNDLIRSAGAATEIKNVVFRQTGALTKRKGQQFCAPFDKGGLGLHRFNNMDIETGIVTEELITFDANAHKLVESAFILTYTGSATAYYDMYFNPTLGKFFFDVYEDNTRIVNEDLGSGVSSTDPTITNLVAALNAHADLTCTVSGSPSTPAAFLPVVRNVSISTLGTSIALSVYIQIPTPSGYTSPFVTHHTSRNSDNFELNTVGTVGDVMYISNGMDYLHKYDGNRIVRAGLPQAIAPVLSEVAGTSFAISETYRYRYLYEYTDAKQNIVEGNLQLIPGTSITTSGTTDIQVQVGCLPTTSGFNTDQAIINGNQTTVTTITVNTGHNIHQGDYVYLADSVSGGVVSRKVTAVTATTVSIEGAAVSVLNTAIISCLKIKILRTKDGSNLFYELDEIVHNSAVTSINYVDQINDSALLVTYPEPVKRRDLPPKGKYIDVWRSSIIMTGINGEVNTVYYSDIDSPEYFPAQNSFIVNTSQGGGNTGIKSLDNVLYVFKRGSVSTVTGDLALDSFQVDPMSDEGIGCIANATIKEIDQRIWFLGLKGIYVINNGSIQRASDPIEPRIRNSFDQKRASALHWIDQDLYIISLPTFNTDGSGNKYFSQNSKIMVFDLFRNAWLEWTSINMTGGAAIVNDTVYLSGNRIEPVSVAAKAYTSRILFNGTMDDYADHTEAIDFVYRTHWESFGDLSAWKKFTRIRVHSLDGTIEDFETDVFDLDVSTQHDFIPTDVSNLNMDFSGSGSGLGGWGTPPWGTFSWGESRATGKSSKLSPKRARALRITFSNNKPLENVLISGYDLEVASPFMPAIKE